MYSVGLLFLCLFLAFVFSLHFPHDVESKPADSEIKFYKNLVRLFNRSIWRSGFL